ncbi:MAG: hypothetical protein O8C60_05625 [Candidatus Methanoperedens sp.]|nr:hypothetical protein [Candidatus Methanoperedens sp.]
MPGCKERKCPCRLWVNCLTYIDMQRQEWRLKNKEYDFYEWYMDNFRGDAQMIDAIVNG